jgi:hypothetical protein
MPIAFPVERRHACGTHHRNSDGKSPFYSAVGAERILQAIGSHAVNELHQRMSVQLIRLLVTMEMEMLQWLEQLSAENTARSQEGFIVIMRSGVCF